MEPSRSTGEDSEYHNRGKGEGHYKWIPPDLQKERTFGTTIKDKMKATTYGTLQIYRRREP